MSYTIENNRVITEKIEGVTQPANYSFACVNDFVNNSNTQFDELQCLCLALASELEEIKLLIQSDKLASSCQSIGQYRKMFLDNIKKLENNN